MAFAEHGLRRQVVGEMHLRRFPDIAPPAQVIQLVRLVSRADREAERQAFAALPGGTVRSASRHAEGSFSSDLRVAWEQHSEASTVTLTLAGADAITHDWAWPDDGPGARALAWAEALPGDVIRATRMMIVGDAAATADILAGADFQASQLVTCEVAGGARIWSDFGIHDDGYGRLVLATNGLPVADVSRCVQKLQELGNYRNLALLGLPLARACWVELDELERRLTEIGTALTLANRRDDDLLDELTGLSAALLSLSSRCDFRMGATAAYARIVADRLAELDVRPIRGYSSLGDFTGRRFNPAVRTCATLVGRMTLAGDRAAQSTALLRTRIETHIENQNARLLASMDRSARMQLRLQHLVEGLSTVAISYYCMGLLSYPTKALDKLHTGFSSTLTLGAAAPLMLGMVWLLMRLLRRRLVSDDDNHTAPAT